jgi:hypothetical protein
MMRRGRQQKAFLLGLAFVLVMTAWSVLHRITPAYGLLARYFDNDSWSGEPVETGLDQKILFDKIDLSGPLRLYAGFSTFRFTWTDDATLRETASILQAMNRPVYFYLDSESAQARYLDLISRSVLEAKNFREVALLNGRPLYRYEFGGAAALTNSHFPR